MLYVITAYIDSTPTRIKSREVRGFDNAYAQKELWQKQGYEAIITMNCLKYIAVTSL